MGQEVTFEYQKNTNTIIKVVLTLIVLPVLLYTSLQSVFLTKIYLRYAIHN